MITYDRSPAGVRLFKDGRQVGHWNGPESLRMLIWSLSTWDKDPAGSEEIPILSMTQLEVASLIELAAMQRRYLLAIEAEEAAAGIRHMK